MMRKGPSMRSGVEQRLKAIRERFTFFLLRVIAMSSVVSSSVAMWGRKLVSGDFHSNSSTYCMAFSSSTKIKRCSFLSNFAAAVSARQASLAFGSRTWKKTALVRGASPFVMCAWEDNAAGDEVFKGVFFGHVEGLDVFFGDEEEKAGDGVRGGGGKYRDEGLSCFFLAF